MPAKLRYNAAYHDDWAWSLAIRGATNQDIADAFGTSRKTIERWKSTYQSFADAIEKGKNAADARVERSLFERATGYETTDTEKVVEVDPRTGESKPVKVRTITKQLPPDTMAGMYWLNNRKREDWGNGRSKTQDSNNAVDDWVNSIPEVADLPSESKDKRGE